MLAAIDGYRVTGPARQLLAVAAPRAGSGANISVAVLTRATGPTPLVVAARRLNVATTVVPDRFALDPGPVIALIRLARRPGIRILESHGYKANVLMCLVSRVLRKPWLAVLHGETWENWKVRAYFGMERAAVRAADRVIVVSRSMGREAAARGVPEARIRMVYNACLTSGSHPEVSGWRSGRAPVIGVVSRLSPEKGVDLALRIHRVVIARHPAARLVIAGEGQERAALEALSGELGLGDSVQWLGYRDDLDPMYGEMDVLLLPSRSEGLPNVILEGMAHGIPVVATAVGGVPEVVTDGGNGFLVPSGDVDGLARSVTRLLDDEALRLHLGREGRRTVARQHDLDGKILAMTRIYEEMIR